MTSKTNDIEVPSAHTLAGAPLQRFSLIEVAGSEAAAFLQRQCMNDVARLDRDGSLQWSGLLSAKGRVRFLFRILRLATERYLLIAADTDSAALADELRRYVFRAKLRVLQEGWTLRGAIDAAAPSPDAIGWDDGRWIMPTAVDASAPAATASSDAPLDDRWYDIDVARGIPRIDDSLSDRFTPQMLGLARLQAFSLSKGCYPGQEIVARTHYLGQQKREWSVLQAVRPMQRDEAVLAAGNEVGRVRPVAPGEPTLGAALLPLGANDGLALTDGTAVQQYASPTTP